MMTDNFEAILDESISALQAGIPIEEILEEVPEYADELRPLLYASALLADPNPAFVPEEKKATLRQEYLRQVAELPDLPHPTLGQKTNALVHIMRRRLTREAILNDLITVAITIILTVAMAAFILSYLAQETIPGDFLYNIKRISENVRLGLTFDESSQADLANEFNQRRLREIEQLIAQQRAAVVEFRGILETKGTNLWVVEGHPVVILSDLRIEGDPQKGDTLEVVGLLRTNNTLVADTIRIVEPLAGE